MLKGVKVRECRIAAGLTQAELAARAGTAVGTIQQYELGIRQPRIDQLSRIADALDLSIMDLLDVTETGEQEAEPKKRKTSSRKNKTGAEKSEPPAQSDKADAKRKRFFENTGAKEKTSAEKKSKAEPAKSKKKDPQSEPQGWDDVIAAVDAELKSGNRHAVTGQINTIAHDNLNTAGKKELLRYALILRQNPDYGEREDENYTPSVETPDRAEEK